MVHLLRALAFPFSLLVALPCVAQPALLSEAPASNRLPSTTHPAVPLDPVATATASDAALHAIASFTEDRLCAAGDRGALLLTVDGGRSWKMLPAITSCNLHAITCTGEFGLAVGGWIGNATGHSRGVVLRTQDGGQTWSILPTPQLPRLTGIVMREGRIVAWGDFSPTLQTSTFESLDGGASWRPLPTNLVHVLAADLAPTGELGAVDQLGRAFFSEQATTSTIAQPASPLLDLQHTRHAWLACGEQGEVITSRDGRAWFDVPLPLSPAARQVVRWHSLTRVSDSAGQTHLWLGGAPGSLLLHSVDDGASWQIVPTGQTLPIEDIHFVDANRGWAVGAQGLILATRDGGQTWYSQRRHARRLGLLSVVDHPERIPWGPLVATAWDDDVGVASLVIHRSPALQRTDFTPGPTVQLSELAPQIGIAQHDTWDDSSDSATTLTERLALELMIWRPDALLSDERALAATRSIDPAGKSPGSLPLTNAMTLAAESDTRLPIAAELRLSPWQVTKLVAVTASSTSQFSEQDRRVLRAPGLAIWDILLRLPRSAREAATSVPMRTVWSKSQAKVVTTSLLGGVVHSPENARELALDTLGNYQLVMGRIHRHKSLEQLVQEVDASLTDEQWAVDLGFILDSLPASEIAPAMFSLAERLSEARRWPRQRIVLEELARRLPASDAAAWAQLQLMRLTSSDEFTAWQAALAISNASSPTVQLASVESSTSSVVTTGPAVWNATPFDAQPASASAPVPRRAGGELSADGGILGDGSETQPNEVTTAVSLASPLDARLSLRVANHHDWFANTGRWLAATPSLRSRPDVQLLVARNLLASGNVAGHYQELQSLEQHGELIGWHQVAKQEILHQAGHVQRLKWLAFAAATASPPILDGNLDEAMWQAVPPMQLSQLDAEEDQPTSSIAWAYDDEYLYLGIHCPRTPGSTPAVAATLRSYDADLDGLDHIQLVLDTDRDYNTAIELGIAENGLTFDRCCGIRSYNPKWHVSVASTSAYWTAEIAIVRTALTTADAFAGAAWAVSAARHEPHGTSHSWSQLRTHRPLLHGSGLLLFAPPVASPTPASEAP